MRILRTMRTMRTMRTVRTVRTIVRSFGPLDWVDWLLLGALTPLLVALLSALIALARFLVSGDAPDGLILLMDDVAAVGVALAVVGLTCAWFGLLTGRWSGFRSGTGRRRS